MKLLILLILTPLTLAFTAGITPSEKILQVAPGYEYDIPVKVSTITEEGLNLSIKCQGRMCSWLNKNISNIKGDINYTIPVSIPKETKGNHSLLFSFSFTESGELVLQIPFKVNIVLTEERKKEPKLISASLKQNDLHLIVKSTSNYPHTHYIELSHHNKKKLVSKASYPVVLQPNEIKPLRIFVQEKIGTNTLTIYSEGKILKTITYNIKNEIINSMSLLMVAGFFLLFARYHRTAMLFLLIAMPAIGVQISASVANINPTVASMNTSSLFISGQNHYFCSNIDTIELNVFAGIYDRNGYEQISSLGSVAVITPGQEKEVQMTFYEGNENTAIYHTTINVTKNNEPTDFKIHVSDGAIDFYSQPKELFFSNAKCTASIHNITNGFTSIDAMDMHESVLYTESTGKGKIAIIDRKNEYTSPKVDQRELGYIEITFDYLAEKNVEQCEIQKKYNIKKAEVVAPYFWNHLIWSKANGGADTIGGYWYAFFNSDTIFAAYGSKRPKLDCSESWICGPWTKCYGDSYQTRKCFEQNSCKTESFRPIESKRCIYYEYDLVELVIPNIIVNQTKEVEKKPSKEKPGREVLFDIIGQIISVHDILVAKVSLFNFGQAGIVETEVTYTINDKENKLHYQETEIVPVQTQLEYIKEIKVTGLPAGKYELRLDLKYPSQIEPASSISEFTINEAKKDNSLLISSIIALILVSASIIYIRQSNKFK